jgi:hypothetical protein
MMKTAKVVVLSLAEPRLQGLRAASRQLRRRLGASAPTVEELVAFQLGGRDPRLIASEFAEYRRRRAA